jgi:hypothetical protein
MSRHDGEDRGCELTIQYVYVGAADADRLDPDHCFTRARERIGNLGERELSRLLEDDGAHYRPQIQRRTNVTDTPCAR